MPMLSASSAPAIPLTEATQESALTGIRKIFSESTRKRGRTKVVLENSDDEEYDDGNSNTLDLEDEQEDVEYVDGMSVFYDHLILPLISIVNVYRHQVKSQEAVIKAKENEVFEALELMEQSGVNHRNRRRVTEPYVKADADAKLQSVSEMMSNDLNLLRSYSLSLLIVLHFPTTIFLHLEPPAPTQATGRSTRAVF